MPAITDVKYMMCQEKEIPGEITVGYKGDM